VFFHGRSYFYFLGAAYMAFSMLATWLTLFVVTTAMVRLSVEAVMTVAALSVMSAAH